MKKIHLIPFLLTLLIFPLGFFSVEAQNENPKVLVLTVDGPVTPSWKEYLERGLRVAAQRDAVLVIFEINTPGGSVSLMQELVEMMRASEIPIVVYVTPRGAMAASAGTVITLAGHAAAMAPETIIGAASPVGAQGEDLGETLQAKPVAVTKRLPWLRPRLKRPKLSLQKKPSISA
jgi:membrane-bound serine protease (ClpP class)